MAELDKIKKRWEELTRGPTGWVIYLVLGVVLAVLLHTGLGAAFSTNYPVVTVESDSMRPTLNPGDIVFVRSVEEYQVGDIIIFDGWKQTPIIHRIVSKSQRTDSGFNVTTWKGFRGVSEEELIETHKQVKFDTIYITKGDNNNNYDQNPSKTKEYLVNEDIYGRKIFDIPYLGWIKLGSMRLLGR